LPRADFDIALVDLLAAGLAATAPLRGLLGHPEVTRRNRHGTGRRYLAVEAHTVMSGQHFMVDGFRWS
jgi:hypothetical protein